MLGISPGLRSLAYCALDFDARGASTLYTGIERGGKAHPSSVDHDELTRKAKPLDLVLDVIFERWTPALVAVGPQFSKKEPELHVEFARVVLIGLVETLREHGLQVNYAEWRTREALFGMLGKDLKASLSGVVNAGEIRGAPLRWAALAALAGRESIRRSLAPSPVPELVSVPHVSRETGTQKVSRNLSKGAVDPGVQPKKVREGRPPVVLSRVR